VYPLKRLCEGSIDTYGTNEDRTILRMIQSFASMPDFFIQKGNFSPEPGIRYFMTRSTSDLVNNKTVFERVYRGLFFGETSIFKTFIQVIYIYWLVIFEDNKNYIGSQSTPFVVDYENNKIIGFYSNDKKFKFEGEYINIVKERSVYVGTANWGGVWSDVEDFLAKVHIFDSVEVATNNFGEMNAPDQVVPAFFIKAIDDLNAWSNASSATWLLLDIVGTFTGFGNLMKLRHLNNVTKLYKSFRVFVAGVEVTSSALNTALRFVDECHEEDTFCYKLRKFLFYLEVGSLSIDALASKYLKRSALNALEDMPLKIQNSYSDIRKLLERFANSIVLKYYEYLAKIFKVRIVVYASKGGAEIVCFQFKFAVVPVNKILKYARGRTRSVDNLDTLKQELRNLKYQRQHNRKTFDLNPKNQKRIDDLEIEIENSIKSLSNRRGLEKIGIYDTEVGNERLFNFILGVANSKKNKLNNGQWVDAYLKGPKGGTMTMSMWKQLDDGTWYLVTIKIFE
jgi:hypothetical protein